MFFWRALTIVVAAVPATIYSTLAFGVAVTGLGHTFVGIFTLDHTSLGMGVLFFLWGSFGLFGTCALWAVGLGYMTRLTMPGLIAGILAVLPFIYMMNPSTTDIWGMIFLTMPVIAGVWIVLFVLRRRSGERIEPSPPGADAGDRYR